MVYQNPGGALNPTIRVGDQVAEVFAIAGVETKEAHRARPGDAAQGADLRPRQRDAALPAPALGRHAAARGDRDGAGQGPVAADPRRADDRARRDGRGRGARPGLRAARGVPLERPVHQPQPRRDHQDVRPRRRALRGPARRGGTRRARSSTTRAIPTRSACCAACRAAACARTSSGWTRSPASCRSSAPTCRRACSSTAAALAQDICSKEEPPFQTWANGRHSRCHFWEQAHELPRTTPSRRAFKPVDQNAEPVIRAREPAQDVPPGGPATSAPWTT